MPKRLVFVDEIPKGPTGKLQRIGLADRLGVESVRPETDPSPDDVTDATQGTIDKISAIWSDVLCREDIGSDDDFLDVGGDSVTASQLVVRVRDTFDLDIPLMAFFDASTIRRQSALVDDLLKSR